MLAAEALAEAQGFPVSQGLFPVTTMAHATVKAKETSGLLTSQSVTLFSSKSPQLRTYFLPDRQGGLACQGLAHSGKIWHL